jgi:phage gp46-like protein
MTALQRIPMALRWNGAAGRGEVQRTEAGALMYEDGLATAVILSLFLDRRARADDRLPDPASTDRRGWVGDAFDLEDPIGSRLWLLVREKQTEETRRRAEEYAAEALDWLVEDGLASAVRIRAEWLAPGLLGLAVEADAITGAYAETLTLRLS